MSAVEPALVGDERAWTHVGAVLRSNRLLLFGAVIAVAIVAIAILAPWIVPYPEDAGSATHPEIALQAPSSQHLFGTDQVGRDVFSRVLYGARVSPSIAFMVLAISILIGVPLGVTAGYFGKIWDDVIMRITDVFLALPALLLALVFAAVLPPSLWSTTLAITIAWWPWYTRLLRGQAASVSGRPFVESARALGVPNRRIVFRHVLPNSFSPLIVTASALSFLGLGAQDPTPDWGLMVAQGQAYFQTQWWLVTFPGLAILITAIGFNLLGDGLREILDPHATSTFMGRKETR